MRFLWETNMKLVQEEDGVMGGIKLQRFLRNLDEDAQLP